MQRRESLWLAVAVRGSPVVQKCHVSLSFAWIASLIRYDLTRLSCVYIIEEVILRRNEAYLIFGFLCDNSMGSLVTELQPMIRNKTIVSAVETLPQSIQLLKSMAQILTKPEIKAIFGMVSRRHLEFSLDTCVNAWELNAWMYMFDR